MQKSLVQACKARKTLQTLTFYKCIIFFINHACSIPFVLLCPCALSLCSYTNKDNLKWQQSIILQQKGQSLPVSCISWVLMICTERSQSKCLFSSFFLSEDKRLNLFFGQVWHLFALWNLYFHCINSGKHLMPVNQCKPSSLHVQVVHTLSCCRNPLYMHFPWFSTALIQLKCHNYRRYQRITFTLWWLYSFSHQTYPCAAA